MNLSREEQSKQIWLKWKQIDFASFESAQLIEKQTLIDLHCYKSHKRS